MLINKAYKFRIYPNKKQEILINKTFGCSRFVYNKYLSKDYQLEQCYYNNKEQEYNELLKQARLDYNNAYHNYLQELGLYLKKIELEG